MKWIFQICCLLFVLGALRISTNAQDSLAYEKMYEEVLKKQSYGKGIAYFQREVKKYPKNYLAMYNLGRISIVQTELQSAIRHFDDALYVNPNCFFCYTALSQLKMAEEDWVRAEELANIAIGIAPLNLSTRFNKVDILTRLGRKFEAEDELDKTIALLSQDADAYYNRGWWMYSQQRFNSAIMDMQAAIRLKPDCNEAIYLLATIYNEQMEFEKTVHLFNESKAVIPDTIPFLILQSNANIGLKNFDSALSDINKMEQLDPKLFQTLYAKGYYYSAIGNWDSACVFLAAAQNVAVKIQDTFQMNYVGNTIKQYCERSTYRSYLERVDFHMSTNDTARAKLTIDEGLTLFPNEYELLLRKIDILELEENYGEVFEILTQMVTDLSVMRSSVYENPIHAAHSAAQKEDAFKVHTAFVFMTMAEFSYRMDDKFNADRYIDSALYYYPDYKHSFEEMYNPTVLNRSILLFKKADLLIQNEEFEAVIPIYGQLLEDTIQQATVRANLAYAIFYAMVKQENDKTVDRNTIGPNLERALMFANQSIALDENNGIAFYIRLILKRALHLPNYCNDARVAKKLGIEINPSLIKDCNPEGF